MPVATQAMTPALQAAPSPLRSDHPSGGKPLARPALLVSPVTMMKIASWPMLANNPTWSIPSSPSQFLITLSMTGPLRLFQGCHSLQQSVRPQIASLQTTRQCDRSLGVAAVHAPHQVTSLTTRGAQLQETRVASRDPARVLRVMAMFRLGLQPPHTSLRCHTCVRVPALCQRSAADLLDL